jgi:acyl transferase domain-containing protein/acyl-CoA synthetase (AMP-forming)/AMP-acid ligase II/ubiquinone/menaquinone biosynthesis C-methylase UbiE/acyl carrier protein
MNIAQHLERTRHLFPNKPALIFEEESFSYSDIDEMSNRVANALVDKGISRGDRVALFLPNIPSFVIVYLGIQKMGAIAVSINSTLKTEEIKFILDDSGAKVIVTTETLRRHVPANELPLLNLVLIAEGAAFGSDIALSEWMAEASPKAQAVDMAHDDPAAILYTSGTTGFPKGATLSCGNVVSNVQTCVEAFKIRPEDRILLFVPMFHNFGQNAALNPCLEAGATLVLHREFEIEPILKSIVNNSVTTFYGVPTIYTLLYDQASVEQLRSVRRYISAAATLPLEMARKWHDKFGVVINEGYGLTENSLACFNDCLKSKPGSVGLPLTGVEMKIVDADGNEVAPGELGEVTISGPNVMLGYWNRPVETAEVIKDGWFHTGDIGKMDDDGYFYIVDRVKDMVNVGGTKVYPSEIENILYQHPAVLEAAVYGVPEALLGEQVIANIILKPGEEVTREEIIAFCGHNMADFKVPSQINLVDSLPKGRTGKILKKVLREQFQQASSSSSPNESSAQQTDHRYPQIKKWIINWLSKKLALEPDTIETDTPFVDYGLTSVLAVNFAQALSDWLGQSIAPVICWNFPTIELMSRYLVSHRVQQSEEVNQRLSKPEEAGDSHLELWPAIEGYFVYDALMYELLANDEPRNRSYQVAIDKLVKDKVVVEIGTGQKVILARLCAEAGARQVYAIEIGNEAYRLAQTKVEELGLSDKITLIHGDATQVTLPEPADVCISEIVGSIGGSQGAAVILNSARRLLKPDGLMIPERSVTKIAAVALPDELLRHPKMTRLAKHYTQKIFEQVGHPFDVRLCLKNFPLSSIISDSAIFEDLDFTQPIPTEYQHEIKLTIKRKSRLDGFLLWLNLHTIRGEVIDILDKTGSWIPIYFPVFEPGVVVSEGNTIQVICSYALCDNQINPDYRIKGHVARDHGENLVFDYVSSHHESNFKQTPFYERLFHRFNADLESVQLSGPSGTGVEASDLSTLSDAELAELLRTVEKGAYQQGGERRNGDRDYRSILKNALNSIRDLRLSLKAIEQQAQTTEELIAVIGMGCRFPGGVHTPDAFWHLLRNGTDTVTEIPNSRWNVETYYEPGRYQPGKMYVRTGSFLEGIDQFDPHFFGITPREAASMDPQQRLLLEVSWEALEHAGVAQEQLRDSRTGVFVGVFWDDYSALRLYGDDPSLIDTYRTLSHLRSLTAGRIAYTLGLQGPVMQLDTACSSSLLATHLACQSLSRKECHLALAGGVDLNLSPERTIGLCSMNLLAPDGRCKTFDAKADGFGQGEGCGIVTLKRFSDAIRDGDNIMALIRGSAVNHDGRSNGLTAPNGLAQEALLRQALENATVNPEQIQYVETHGTGTSLGDPIEVLALANVLSRERTTPLAIGSVKTNLGHLSSAAGIASLMKVVLSLQQAEIPPNLHFSEPNPQIPWQEIPIRVPTEPTPWTGEPRLAGVSSFGMSGTNVHLIVEEAPKRPAAVPTTVEPEYQLFVLSAKNEERLQVYAKKIIDFLEQKPATISLLSLTYTLQLGRNAMEERLAMVVSSVEEVREKLTRYAQSLTEIEFYRGNVKTNKAQSELLIEGEAGEAFLRIIIEKKELNKLAQLWVYGVNIDWQLLYPNQKPQRISLPTYPFARERYWIQTTSQQMWSAGKMSRLHPLIDQVELKHSLKNQGVVFQKTLNQTDLIVKDHQVREQPILPGVGYLEMAMAAGRLVTDKGQLKLARVVWQQPLAVLDAQKEVQILIQEQSGQLTYQIKSREGTRFITHATGEIHPVSRLPEQRVDIEEIKARCTHYIEPESLYKRFQDRGIHYGAYFQGVSELWGNASEGLGRLELPEVFEQELQHYTLHPTLMDGALQTIAGIGTGLSSDNVPQLPFAVEEVEMLQPLSAHMYAYVKANGPQRFHVAMLDETGLVCLKYHEVSLRALPDDPLEHFFYAPRWRSQALTATSTTGARTASQTILIVYPTDSLGLEKALAAYHPQDDKRFIKLGDKNQTLADNHWEINTQQSLALERCIEALGHLDMIYYLGGLQPGPIDIDDLDALEASQERGVLSLFRLLKVLSRQGLTQHLLQLNVITNDVFRITSDDEITKPFAASLYGLSKAAAKEYPQLTVRCIDISLEETRENASHEALMALVAPILIEPDLKGEEVVFRDGKRYVRTISAIKLPTVNQTPFKHQGVYLILGGAGGIGLELSHSLAKTVQARLILLGRRELSAPQLNLLSQIEAQGGKVLYLQADATDLSSMRTAVEQAKSQFGQINGVIHSAIVLKDKTIDNMDEDTFRAALAPKVQGSVVLHKVLQHEQLDFMMFFSSAQSFTGNAGQSNYAAGCTFKDAFAHALKQYDYPVKIINWGYWGGVGIVATNEYRQRLAAAGIQSIKPHEGMEAISRILSHRVTQIMPLKAEAHALENMGIDLQHQIEVYPATIPSLFEALVSQIKLPDIVDIERVSQMEKAFSFLTLFGQQLLLEAFQRLGVFQNSGEHYDTEKLLKQLNIVPAYARLYDALLEILEQAGFVGRTDSSSLITTEALDNPKLCHDLTCLEERKHSLIESFPELQAHIRLLWVCLKAYPSILTGRQTEKEVMFPNGSMSLVEGIYQGNPLTDYYNILLAALVKHYIHQRLEMEPSASISILEVGAGTGGSSAFVLAALKEYDSHVRYFYTDISVGFTQYGQKTYGADYPFVEFVALNIEQNPEPQGFALGSIDLMFGTNVFHATKQISNTLNQAKRLLKTHGLLLLNEITQPQDFATLTFGLTEGWWLFEDEAEALRCPSSPLLSPRQWQNVLETNGIWPVQLMALPERTVDNLEQCVIVAESNGIVRVPRHQEAHVSPEQTTAAVKQYGISVQPKQVVEAATTTQPPLSNEPVSKGRLTDNTLDYVKSVFSAVLKLKKNRLDDKANFDQYGVDSLVVLDLNKQFEKDFGKLPTTLLFEHKTLKELTDYFLSEHLERLGELFPLPADNLMTEDLFHPLPSSEMTAPSVIPSVSVENLTKGEPEKEVPLSHQKANDEISDMVSQLSDADVDAIINSLLNRVVRK